MLGLSSLPDSFRYLVIHPERHCLSAAAPVNTSRPGTDQLGAYLDTSGSPIARSEFDAPELVGGDVARRNALI